MGSRPLESILSRHWRPLVLVVIFSLCFNALMLTLPLYMLSIFSHVLTSKNADTLWLLTLVAAIALALQAMIDIFRSRILVRVGLSIEATLGPQVIESMIRRRPDASTLEPRTLNDAAELRRFVTDSNLLTLIDLPFIPLYLVVIAWLHPALGAVALAGALLQLLVLGAGDLLVRRPMAEASSARRRGRDLGEETLRNAELVRAMGMMPALSQRLRRAGRESLLWLQRSADRASGLRSTVRALRIGLQIALYCTGAWLFLNDALMVGAIVAASVLLTRVMSPLDSAIPAWRGFLQAREAFARLNTQLTEPAAEPVPESEHEAARQPAFEVRRALVRAPDSGRALLNRISVSAQPGELLGIVGACGSGKSVLGKLLAGAWQPTSGSLFLQGRDLRDWSARERATLIGYCPQEPQLFAAAIDENIARFDGSDSSHAAVVRAARAVGLDSMVSALPDAYQSHLAQGGLSLPAGMRQQLSLARAFYGEPRLVILDEPTAWLDSAAQQALFEAIRTARENGAAVVVITHQPALLRRADRIAVLNNGSIEAIGAADKVMAHLSGATKPGATLALGDSARPATPPRSAPPIVTGTV
jgi:PrtD family type I secretion system ABC transporter